MSAILLLGADFQPMAVISQRRALGLILAAKADPVEGEPILEIRSPSRIISLPTVVRLKYYVRVPHRSVHWSKSNVLRRDHYACQFCGIKMTEASATVDHIIPVSECRRKGIPPNTWSNTVACCQKCQMRKADRSMHEAGMVFVIQSFEPKAPRVNYLVLVLQNSRREEWRKYIRL